MPSLLLSPREVRGLLDGSISVLRRPVASMDIPGAEKALAEGMSCADVWRGPFSHVGAVLVGKEAWTVSHDHFGTRNEVDFDRALADAKRQMPWSGVIFSADANGSFCETHRYPWRSPATMPAWASRLPLVVTGLRVERFLDGPHTPESLAAEGFAKCDPLSSQQVVASILEWDRRHGKRFPASGNHLTWRAEVRRA